MAGSGPSLGDYLGIRGDPGAKSVNNIIWEGMMNLALIWATSVFKDIWSGVWM